MSARPLGSQQPHPPQSQPQQQPKSIVEPRAQTNKTDEQEKKPEEPSKPETNDADTEEIADDLSEISDEADDILNRQEVKIRLKADFFTIYYSNLLIRIEFTICNI